MVQSFWKLSYKPGLRNVTKPTLYFYPYNSILPSSYSDITPGPMTQTYSSSVDQLYW